MTDKKMDRWVQDLLSKNITREVTNKQGEKKLKIIGLDDREVSQPDYLADIRAFRDEMNQQKAYWTQKLYRKKLVLSSDPAAKDPKTITLEELPQEIENFTVAAYNTVISPFLCFSS
ncbi:hypothetical protein EG329_003965 [Mollisiaceae sp. DMI_Dod_QoI]|nr:hypothetical protein EG329_003965 [Helotiales sp. DMI_Dod_QoI]